ncbi:DoxX family protein [bacterium]|nr:DoxX family protein [bacterium]
MSAQSTESNETKSSEGRTKMAHIYTAFLRSSLSILFIGAGLAKLMSHQGMVELFEFYNYPHWLIYLVGVAEVGAAVGLLVDKTRFLASGMICVVMLGAGGTHLAFQEYQMFAVTSLLFFVSLKLIFDYSDDTEFEVDEHAYRDSLEPLSGLSSRPYRTDVDIDHDKVA